MTRSSRLLSLILSCLMLLAFAAGMGCSSAQRRVQVVAASTLADAANGALPTLTAAYQTEGDRAIDAAPTQAEARAARDAVRARWASVWKAWAAVRSAQNAWATALDSGASADDINREAYAMKDAYCALKLVVPGVVLPEVPGFGCGP